MDRAINFYQTVFDLVVEREVLDGYEMAFFTFDSNRDGASGSLVQGGDVYKPTSCSRLFRQVFIYSCFDFLLFQWVNNKFVNRHNPGHTSTIINIDQCSFI